MTDAMVTAAVVLDGAGLLTVVTDTYIEQGASKALPAPVAAVRAPRGN